MATIAENLSTLDQLRKDLATNVSNKGVTADQTEKLSTLVPKVANIPTEGYGGKLQTKTVVPTTESQIITPDRGYDGLSKVSVQAVDAQPMIPNLTPSKIKSGVSILNMSGYSLYGDDTHFGNGIILSADNITATPGSTVILPISIWANNQCNAYWIWVMWDTANITCEKANGAFAVVTDNENNRVGIINLQGTPFSDGVVSRIHLNILDAVTVGMTYHINIFMMWYYDGFDMYTDGIGCDSGASGPYITIPGSITII